MRALQRFRSWQRDRNGARSVGLGDCEGTATQIVGKTPYLRQSKAGMGSGPTQVTVGRELLTEHSRNTKLHNQEESSYEGE